ncbi:MAG: 50S ribosomal protein L4 [Deltaproteobacteria bacterium]|nr:50S ribosomal protein L4 [Deltaproteobacteria bacterium]MBW1812195.1 50S ribosomal protein L4 [Deltaproteobacteria bacterium]MBW1845711.1 50S ribosomal protein L4 [Deltaproteobacteria bacterium]MBW2179014.1 50S ribosomal protein L4 [Deltaproteobacteria bacterium]
MAVVDVLNIKGKKVSQKDLADDLFDVSVKPSVLHEVVTMQLANRRSGTAAVKHRSDVTGSQRKLFRQKGTGRARRGNIKDPLLRGGGSIFGPDPRSYAYKVPKKVKRLALKMALSSKYHDKDLMVLDQLELEQVKTKEFVSILNTLGIQNGLIITEKKDERLELSARNVENIKVLRSDGLNVYDILKHKKLVLIEASVNTIEGRLRK